ncbi:DUF952 domain-containing protein [Bradyrhizobium sp. WSM 1738]|uniref:DUF952 domain-containing protein n=1 Tax=Bradyrhizobium hereditatis TaxID=2821405 RepID=UPI0035DF0B0B|nr:DUF952 domain-containing protein [Bradyrhizobium hereditatis]
MADLRIGLAIESPHFGQGANIHMEGALSMACWLRRGCLEGGVELIRLYGRGRGRRSLVLLIINPERVIPPIRYEDAGNGKLYPHIYGASRRMPLSTSSRLSQPLTGHSRCRSPGILKLRIGRGRGFRAAPSVGRGQSSFK